MRKESLRRGVWYIGGSVEDEHKKELFFPVGAILGSLAGPLLGSVVEPVLKKKYLMPVDDADADMPEQNILLRRRTTPQQERLPNGQLFLARYERVSRRKSVQKCDNNKDKTSWA